jgi:hypothetical protein
MLTLTGQCKYVKMALDSEKAMNRRSKRTGVGREGGSGAESPPQRKPLKVAWEPED